MRRRSLDLRRRRLDLHAASVAYRRSRQRLDDWDGMEPSDPGVRAAVADFRARSEDLYVAAEAVLRDILTPTDRDADYR